MGFQQWAFIPVTTAQAGFAVVIRCFSFVSHAISFQNRLPPAFAPHAKFLAVSPSPCQTFKPPSSKASTRHLKAPVPPPQTLMIRHTPYLPADTLEKGALTSMTETTLLALDVGPDGPLKSEAAAPAEAEPEDFKCRLHVGFTWSGNNEKDTSRTKGAPSALGITCCAVSARKSACPRV